MIGKNGPVWLALLFFAALGGGVLGSWIPVWVPAFYGALSVVTWVAYWIDKSAARKGNDRTPEKTLHLLALAGGWPGAMVVQQVIRHKTQKRSFRTVFWITVALNCGALVALLVLGQGVPAGAALVRSGQFGETWVKADGEGGLFVYHVRLAIEH